MSDRRFSQNTYILLIDVCVSYGNDTYSLHVESYIYAFIPYQITSVNGLYVHAYMYMCILVVSTFLCLLPLHGHFLIAAIFVIIIPRPDVHIPI